MRLKSTNNKGDTIVEVLIALTVLMVVIAGGYSIAVRSLNAARIAQERSEATKIAQGQLEAINQRILEAENLINLLDGTVPNNSSINRGNFIGGSSISIAGSSGLSPGFCVDDTGTSRVSSDTVCRVGFYNINITTDTATIQNTPNTQYLVYTVNINWLKSGGGGNEELILNGRYVIQ